MSAMETHTKPKDQIDRIVAGVGSRFAAVMKDRIITLGVLESGAYEFYADRLLVQGAYDHYEKPLIYDLALRPPNIKLHIVHAGIGLGPVALALSALGHSVIGFEGDIRRGLAADALRSTLAEQFPSISTRYELRKAQYPAGLRRSADASDIKPNHWNILLFTNVASNWGDEAEEATIATFKDFQEVILHAGVFNRVRNEAERDELLARVSRYATSITDMPIKHNGACWSRVVIRQQ
jgi:hypothetical protein